MTPDRIKLEECDEARRCMQGERPVRIWSREHGAYWRPNGNGYTQNPAWAGTWPLSSAWRATRHCGPEKRIEFELVA